MLRSLVGSEMCIRDRQRPGRKKTTVVHERRWRPQGHPAGRGDDEAGRRGCLLYTSDAADDLLCVDLGGRRIIKKKNKNNTTNSKSRVKQNINTP